MRPSRQAIGRVWALGLMIFLLVAPALAQEVDSAARGAARSLGYEGIQAYQAGDIPTAVDRLERAYRVLRVPSLALWSARALEASGKWVEASERFLEATRLPIEDNSDRSVQEQAQSDARAAEAGLRPKIPLLVIEVRGISPSLVEVSRDGIAVNSALLGSGLPTNPGEVLVVGAAADQRREVLATAVEGQSTPVVLDFTPKAAPPPESVPETQPAPAAAVTPVPDADPGARKGRTQRIIGWGLVGAGGAGVILGVVAGSAALAERSKLDNSGACSGTACANGTDIGTLNTMRVLSSVGFIAGGVLAAGGTALVLTAPKSKGVAVRARLGIAALELEGRF